MTIRERLFAQLVAEDCTDRELAQDLNLPAPSVRRYRRELQLAGRIEPCGETPSGAVIWRTRQEAPKAVQTVCPLCSGKGWILRAPRVEPIPLLGTVDHQPPSD